MHLVFYNDDFFNDVKAYRLDDASFTGVPIEIIEEYKNQDDFYPILCFEEDKLVCFFALDGSANKLVYTDNQNSFLIRAFSTDSNEVRKGYATKSLLALESFVKMNFEGVDEIVLGVNVKNPNAYKMYLKAGFDDTTRTNLGPRGYQNVLNKFVRKEAEC